MSEEKKEGEHGKGEHGKDEKKKPPIKLIAIAVVALLAIGGGAFVFLGKKGSSEKKEEAAHEEGGEGEHGEEKEGGGEKKEEHAEKKEEHGEKKEEHAKKEEHGEKKKEEHGGGDKKPAAAGGLVDLDPFVVNLADTSESRFVKVTIKLKLAEAGDPKEVEAELPSIRDSLLILLSSKEFSSIRTVQGKLELRDEIIERINTVLNGPKVAAVFFTEFVVQ